jgi:hypothetical protein
MLEPFMKFRPALLCALVVAVNQPLGAREQSASQVIERYLDAIGGKKAVEKITSTELSGSVTSTDGRSGTFTQRTLRPQFFNLSLSWGDSRQTTGFNGRSAWQDDARDGLRTLYGPAASRVRAEASFANTHFLASEQLSQILVIGQDQVRGHAVIAVVAFNPEAMKRTLFFDAGSYLLVKDEQQTEAGLEERFFDDYRAVDRVMEPHRIEWQRNGETFRFTVERVTHNAPLDAKSLDAPVAVQDPPLDINAVLSAADQSERRLGNAREAYSYIQSQTSGRVDEQGRVAHFVGPSYEFFYLGGRPVRRLIKKMGGEALSEAERIQEEERVKSLVREYEQQRLSGRVDRRVQEVRGLRGTLLRMPMESPDWFPAFLRMSEFSHVRRETVRGRPAVVVDFQPKRGVTPMNDFERQVARMAGTLWNDEASRYVIRIESFFREDYDRTGRGSTIRAERVLINGEVWLPSQREIDERMNFAFGKFALFFGTIQFTDYKKFTVEATVRSPQP